MRAELLEDFLQSSPDAQDRFIQTQRDLDQAQDRLRELESKSREQLEERWLRVPRWRRAIILAAQWIQLKFTPKWL